MPSEGGECLPLFGGERRNRLERLEAAWPPFKDERLGAEFVGPTPGPDARCREKIPTADPEELRILTNGYRQLLILDASPIVSAENQHRRIAVAAVDVRFLAGNVARELRHRHKQRAVDVEWLDRARTRRLPPGNRVEGNHRTP